MSAVVEPQKPPNELELAPRENGQSLDEKKEPDKSQEGSSSQKPEEETTSLLKKKNSEVPAEKKENKEKNSQEPQTEVEVEDSGCCSSCTCGNRWNAACCVGCLCCDCCDCCLSCKGCECGPCCDCSRPHVDDVCRKRWGCIHPTLIVLLVLAAVGIFVAIVLLIVPAKKMDTGMTASTTIKMTVAPSSPTTGIVTTNHSATATTGVTTAYPGSVISGEIKTTANYTAALGDSFSEAYMAFEKDFSDAMEAFYNGTSFSQVYDGVTITQILDYGGSVEVWFEVRVAELDVSVESNAFSVLDGQLSGRGAQLGKWYIIERRLSVT